MYILGIACFYHDAAAALIKDGVVICAAEEERFTRMKHDHRFPTMSIDFCLAHAGITAEDLTYVVFYEKPAAKLDRVLTTLGKRLPASMPILKEVFSNWGREKIWVQDIVSTRLKIPRSKVLFSEHHLSHAASSFFCSPFTNAAILTVDGVGEWVTSSYGWGEGTKIHRSAITSFPHSLGLFYSAMTEFLGFEVNEGEYKVMGMAPYGTPRYVDKIQKLFRSVTEDSFELDLQYFSFEHSVMTSLTPKLLALLGEPRKKEEPFLVAKLAEELPLEQQASNEVMKRSEYYADIAASVQRVVEDVLLGFCRGLRKQNPGVDNLCIAGGVGYNSAANGRVLRESGFKELYIQPASGDSGAAIGAALAVWVAETGKRPPQPLTNAYLGKAYDPKEAASFLKRSNHIVTECSDDGLIDQVSDLLVSGKVIGWHQGRFEFGPRALGARSILADPRSIAMKEVVNARVKFRELFRPFAPSCLVEKVEEYFEVPHQHSWPLRFMLGIMPVKAEARTKLQATTHVDGSARVQTVYKDESPRYHQLISAFGDKSGVYTLLNTSFNRRGEPIVSSPQDALTTFEWTAIDALVVGNCIVQRR